MSYIRCLSNPEGLYIWHDINGQIAISQYGSNIKWIPYRTFNGLIKKWNRNYWEYPCKYGLANLEEVWIPTQSKISVFINGIISIILSPYYYHKFNIEWKFPKPSEFKNQIEAYKIAYFHRAGKYQIRLSYNDWHIDMWDVTWSYIAKNN
jgi:hypothetical protein